ncbi:hypothetical protein SAY87_027673 [Trapa incisa]|uniref:D-aminoacid aminotransferase-like PLP-dependent enzymes superfamily protein n=1 Tax=Trapa incisa TaxID=236973 RepID=A0AAN7JMT4_9MYRT|nr:hypothetical protein SAY87_027673 [Trapa incisa]
MQTTEPRFIHSSGYGRVCRRSCSLDFLSSSTFGKGDSRKMSSTRFLFSNGVITQTPDVPPVSSFLEAYSGAYTTTRTHNNISHVLLWEQHLKRLAGSVGILFNTNPEALFGPSWFSSHSSLPASIKPSHYEPIIQSSVNKSMSRVVPLLTKTMNVEYEWAITVLVCGNSSKLAGTLNLDEEKFSRALDVHIHISSYIPMVFGAGGAHLALVGRGRTIASAKHSDWVRHRKSLEKLRPHSVTELLLSNDGEHILEGSVSNFFVVCRRDENSRNADADEGACSSFEVQTAPLGDGVLPGVIRQLVIEVCSDKGIPIREAAPSWSKCELWKEAFITNGLRILQHEDSVRAPSIWNTSESRSLNGIEWEEKHFKGGPGIITTIIEVGIQSHCYLVLL